MARRRNAFCLFLIFLICNGYSYAQQDVFVRDILDSPQRYYNLQVILKGEVVDVQTPPAPGERGYYVLIDESDKKIRVIASTLPAPQSKITVVGIVQIFPEDQEPYIREINRTEGIAGIPKEGDVRKTICKDGSEIIVARFSNGQWVPTGAECPASLPWIAYVLAALIVITTVAIIVILVRRNRAKEVATISPAQGTQPYGFNATGPSQLGPEKTRQVSISEIEKQVGGMKTKQVPSMLAELRILTGPLSGKSFPLGFETVIGRVRGDIILEDASVSREHAKIIFLGNKYIIENLSATNPAILNGEVLKAQKELKSGDEIIVGLIKMQFRLI